MRQSCILSTGGTGGHVFPTIALAGSIYCDNWGNCFGSGINTYTDSWGNTSGSIGGNSFSCHTDSWGNTTCN